MRFNIKSVQGVRGVLCIFSILSKLRNSKLFLEVKTHHDRSDTLDGVNGEPPLFMKSCGNCEFHETLTHGPKELYFRCKSEDRMKYLKRSREKDGPFFNAVPFHKLFEETECPFWSRHTW